ncbi:MAG: cyclopropane-fatty-acyl-phospholipid synthase [Ignavibacteria bacterium RIFOXYB2_FULL_35_12]|nr:MAG: cyclopropane-fatty-acyl-phospholipid synthase [Ignavibacteria bacterium GWA2_36_19]OGU51407.1 MAG: cyclopropane-fatty-acyl-phospholipid synthase [Ignavibacteria bacterium GWC2_35_8]OGU59122.1 MAG: cyclopropane-fatty-acyl-phospholipid synthase [Ignavibacteria bacterium GWF2_35_20]OGU82030.1 MAG: cyclopropane-fatty-acyl-phospholipid synthase [Ignavibacteria bacterium RIFOXYA2_FULL_35_9]OGU88612.1 MAG: cyclopropane-fatty-acyl-phospholipid synthase [Ignavibacteria bacterium RIFOXYA12_FULL_3
MNTRYKNLTENLLSLAGIEINGIKPWDIQVHDERFYKRAITEVELGLGESYMDGWWDVEKLDDMIYRIIRADLQNKVKRNLKVALQLAGFYLINMQARRRAYIIGERHYDLGNDLFQNMLDKRLNYSCAYWKGVSTLDEAQVNKLELICNKLYLKPGMKVLDIGCGWGAFGKYAAEKYNVEVVGITVSKEQVELGKELCKGLPVEIRLQDYREVNEKFDRIVSVGMIEHVGYKNYKKYFEIAKRDLKDDGLFLLHTIGEVRSTLSTDAWTHKYIFPNGMLPSIAQLGKAIEGKFVMEDWHNIGADYDKTLIAWYDNFKNSWNKIKDKYSERFYRMWEYFLLSSAGAFRARNKNQLWQIVLSKNGVLGGYNSVR